MAEFPAPREGFVLTHFIVTSDVGRSRRFYAGVLGGEVLLEGQPTIVALANSWIIINASGPPTDDGARYPAIEQDNWPADGRRVKSRHSAIS